MSRPRRPRVVTLAVVALVVLALDQLTKAWALAALEPGVRTRVLGDLFGLELIFNPGAALSFASGMTWVFTVAAVGVTIVIVRVARRLGSTGWAVGLGLLLGGAVGNLIDRLVRPPSFGSGHVVDFLAYGRLFIGNVADIAIVAAAALIVILSMRGTTIEGVRLAAAAPPTEEALGTATGEPSSDIGQDVTGSAVAHEPGPSSVESS